jgi:hypothetical protein
MSRTFLAALNEWNRKVHTTIWKWGEDCEKAVQHPDKPSPTAIIREVERFVSENRLPSSLRNLEKDWEPRLAPQKVEEVILCRIVDLGEATEAICAMFTGDHEIPRVSFPAAVLRQKGLRIGSWFNWRVRSPALVQPSDIDPNVPQAEELATVDMDRLEALHEEMVRGRAEDGGNWPVFTDAGE